MVMQTKHTTFSVQCSAVPAPGVVDSAEKSERASGKLGGVAGVLAGVIQARAAPGVEEVFYHMGRAGLGGTLGCLVGEDGLVKVTAEGGLHRGLTVDIAVQT